MSYPSYSYLSPATLNMALDLARVLRGASEDVSTLAFGESSAVGLSMGRAGDRIVATRGWVGPHRDTFDRLMDNELDSARTTTLRLAAEADAWARFWARATNARNNRLHDEAMAAFNSDVDSYETASLAYQDAIGTDPEAAVYLRAPIAPVAPSRPPYVTAPTAENNYWPS